VTNYLSAITAKTENSSVAFSMQNIWGKKKNPFSFPSIKKDPLKDAYRGYQPPGHVVASRSFNDYFKRKFVEEIYRYGRSKSFQDHFFHNKE
jgi:hypothetical protein